MSKLDDFVGNAREFPILREWDFFNHAGVACLPRRASDAIRAYADQAETAAYIDSGWYRQIEELRALSAKMINAHDDEIALVKNTSEGIAIVARGLSWQKGDRIVTTAVEYPANMYPWMDVAKREGVELALVAEEEGSDGRRRVSVDKILEAAAHPKTKLIALSHVEFASGQRLEIARVGNFCRERGILFCCDAIQSMGILPIDVQEMKIDFLAADGHKWLLGPEGAGIFYIRKELLERVHPPQIGWANVVNKQDYDRYDFTFPPTAARYESGTPNVPGFLGLLASMKMLDEIGVENIAQRIKVLTDYLEAELLSQGFKVASPREEGAWSGSIAFSSDKLDLKHLQLKLRKEHKIEVALRGGRLRCSPHFYNSIEQIARLMQALTSEKSINA